MRRILRGAFLERHEILSLHFVQGQNDKRRRAQNNTPPCHCEHLKGAWQSHYAPRDCGACSEAYARNPAPRKGAKEVVIESPSVEGRRNLIGQTQNTIVVRPFKVVQSCPGTRLKPRTTFLHFELSFRFFTFGF